MKRLNWLFLGVLAVVVGCGSNTCPPGNGNNTCDVHCQVDSSRTDSTVDTNAPNPDAYKDMVNETFRDGQSAEVSGDTGPETINPGGFGAACKSNKECDSGYCIQTQEGFKCTKTCVTDCPVGWSCRTMMVGNDLVSICTPTGVTLCRPCKLDTDCDSGRCVKVEGKGYCGLDCGNGRTTCPQGYTCVDAQSVVDGTQVKQCLPVTKSCTCNLTTNGKTRVCVKENDNGRCFGHETCDKDKGWVGCDAQEPGPEKCDGKDDNCNGITDEFPTDKPTKPCEKTVEGIGTCKGDWVCKDGGWQCTAATPQKEVCDGKDNNCDGKVDETWPNLGKPCTVGTGECAATGVYVCKADGKGVQCNATPGEPSDEVCDGKDNNCDGKVDEAWPNLGKPCTVGTGECAATGVYVCKADGKGVQCNAVEGQPQKEVCDGKDNNCNGKVDEDWPVGQPCSVGKGECRRVGTYVCNAQGDDVTCNAVQGNPQDEKCDGKDDNCNGKTDEAWPEKGTVCYAGKGACRAAGKWVCSKDGSTTVCDAKPGKASPETCNYIDDNCDGLTDETFKDAQGRYTSDQHCGNCFTDCTSIWTSDKDHAKGVCNVKTGSPTCTYVCDSGYVDADGNPDNGCELLVDKNAIYVSVPTNGGKDDDVCGAWNQPCATITHGIERATNMNKTRVLVSEGIYWEQIKISNGISLLGGYNAVTWQRDHTKFFTIIQGHTAGTKHTKTVIADSIDKPTEISGFVIYGENNAYIPKPGESGGNSYAIYVKDSTDALTIRDNTIYAGKGGDGAAGASGTPGANGGDGNAGHDGKNMNHPCSSPLFGGSGGQSSCGTEGGAGANAACPYYQPWPHQQSGVGATGQGDNPGQGGVGGYDGLVYNNCNSVSVAPGKSSNGSSGKDGADGTDGTGGKGCSLAGGSIQAGEWVPANAEKGSDGTNGSGGGGGGPGGGVYVYCGTDYCCATTDSLGGAGGGGGAGGCHGTGGQRGMGGGASIGIMVLWSNGSASGGVPKIHDNTIIRNEGGNGGKGGSGGIGGLGGKSGEGGGPGTPDQNKYNWAVGEGGHGGAGGNGGAGGGGGGGCGGASYGILTHGTTTDYCAKNKFDKVGGGGHGGAGGESTGHPGTAGAPGAEKDCQNL